MEISFFFAKVFGLLYLIVGLIVLKRTQVRKISEELSKNEGLRFVFSLIVLLIGIVTVATHNIWSEGWKLLITLLGWLTLLKGASALWMEEDAYKRWIQKWNSKSIITVGGVAAMIIGLYLSYIGFFI